MNDVLTYHNNQLRQTIEDLRKENPNVIIVYGDSYNAFKWVYQHAPLLGEFLFNGQDLMLNLCKSLVVLGGYFDFNMAKMRGAPNVPVCLNPNERISWDGIQLTESIQLILDILPNIHCKVYVISFLFFLFFPFFGDLYI